MLFKFLRSLTALGPSPAPAGGVRGNADGPSTIDPVQFSFNPVQFQRARTKSTKVLGPRATCRQNGPGPHIAVRPSFSRLRFLTPPSTTEYEYYQ